MTLNEQIRRAAMECLYGTRKMPVGESFIVRYVSLDVGCEKEAVMPEVNFLKEAGFVQTIEDPFGPTLYYKLTPSGVLHYERNR
jgi:hypothetical protein